MSSPRRWLVLLVIVVGGGLHGCRRVQRAAAPKPEVARALPAPNGWLIHGRVVDAGGGVVPGATVGTSATEPGGARVQARTDGSGRFALRLSSREADLHAEAPGYARTSETVDAGSTSEIELALKPAAVLAGTVVLRETGQPVAGAEVVAFGRTGVALRVGAWDDEQGEASADRVDPAAPLELRLVDGGGATVRGHVRYPDGQPVSRAVIWGQCGHSTAQAVAGAGGEYRLRHLGSGRALVVANDRGLGSVSVTAPGPPHVAQVQIDREDQVLDGVDLVLPRRDRVVRGRVLDHRGKPVAGISVFVATDDPVARGSLPDQVSDPGESTATNRAGNFVIAGLPAAAYRIWAEDPEHRGSTPMPASLSKPITIKLPRRGPYPFLE